MSDNSRTQGQRVLSNSQLEQVQAFSGKLIELLGEQAEKEVPLNAVAVALLARALDFVHFTFGKESAERPLPFTS